MKSLIIVAVLGVIGLLGNLVAGWIGITAIQLFTAGIVVAVFAVVLLFINTALDTIKK